jgi:hypothetical protein
MALEKTFDDINETDVRQLTEDRITERKTIEYKECLPDEKHDSKKEFLADVSSFGNTVGGYLLYGIKEENGIPVALPGVINKDLDHETQRLENLLRDSIQPRLQGISIKSINIEEAKPVLIVHVPQSWSKPHVVNFQGHWRFYARNSAGKYPLDVMELKSVFLATSALGERIRNFHFDRLTKIASEETPTPLGEKARIILHIVPYSAFESRPSLSFAPIEKDVWSFPLIYSSVSGHRYNLDGLMAYSDRSNNLSGAYAQVFRNGIIESVNTTLFSSGDGDLLIPSVIFEEKLVEALKDCLALHQKLSITPPSVLMVSLTGVRGYKLAVHHRLDIWHEQAVNRIDRDTLLLPEVIVEDYAINPGIILRPIFDAVWNSAGWPRSYGYNETGEWGKGPNFRR